MSSEPDDADDYGTAFYDMRSGGHKKTAYDAVFIHADEDTARKVFVATFKTDPDAVACECCGRNFDVSRKRLSGLGKWVSDAEVYSLRFVPASEVPFMLLLAKKEGKE